MELMFFISTLFPPLIEIFTSALIVPSPRAAPLYCKTRINSFKKVLASLGDLISGSVTISTSGIPERLKLTIPWFGLY